MTERGWLWEIPCLKKQGEWKTISGTYSLLLHEGHEELGLEHNGCASEGHGTSINILWAWKGDAHQSLEIEF